MTGPSLPRAMDSLAEIQRTLAGRRPAFFLDFDGTLAPESSHPDLAQLPEQTRSLVDRLARDHLVCFVSGRDLVDLRRKVDIPGVYLAADHGYRVVGPPGSEIELVVSPEDHLELETAAYELEHRLHEIGGVVIETKGTSLSVHYRLVAENDRPLVHRIVADVASRTPGLALTGGKMVHELRPRLPWGKGRAVLWLLGRLRLRKDEVCPICLGDDLTDEDMFVAVRRWGVSVAVGRPLPSTRAEYLLEDPAEAAAFLRTFLDMEAPPSVAPV